MKRAHRGKDKYKVQFTVTLRRAVQLGTLTKEVKGDVNGHSVYVGWRRGTKKQCGDSKRVIVANNQAEWKDDERFEFESKLFMDPKSRKFDEKKLTLSLKEDNSKKKTTVTLAKVSIDLSNFAQSNGSEVITIPFVKGAPSRGPCLLATIRTRPLKYNDKVLVKVTGNPGKDSRLVKTIAGEDYFLDRTASNPSPTTLDTASVASGDEDDDFEADSSQLHDADSYSVSASSQPAVVDELRRRIEDLSQQVEAADSESFSRLSTIREKDKEISSLQKEAAKLRRDKDELVEQMERLKKPAGKSEVDTLRAESVDRLAQINTMEKEIAKLKQELSAKDTSREREVRNDATSSEVAALKSRLTSMQQDNERLTKLLRDKEKEGRDKDRERDRDRDREPSSNGRGSDRGSVSTNVVLSRDGREDDLRRQVGALKQEIEEKSLLEKSIYCVEPQFRAGLSISATLILDSISSGDTKGNKDKEKEKSMGHTLNLIINGMETAVKRAHTDNAMLCYWLSTCISMLIKLRKKQDNDIYDSNLQTSSSTTSPLTRFEYALTALATKIYSQLIRNIVSRLEEELVGLLLHSHHMPRGTPLAMGAGLVLNIMNQLHASLLEYHVPAPIASQLFTQFYYYINAVLFNCMVSPGTMREELCTCNSGFRIRLQLSRLEEWVPNGSPPLLSAAQLVVLRDQLAPAVQASKLLVIDKKLLTDPEVFEQLCPVLGVSHIRRILSNFLPDALSPEPIPSAVSGTLDILEKKERDRGASPQTFEFDSTVVRNLSLSFLSGEK